MVEAALRRKREELGRKWQERERVLERVRAREREMERELEKRGGGGGGAGGRKRVRVDDGTKRGVGVDEEREFLVGEWEGGGEEAGDALEEGGLSRETRELMERVGLGGGKRREDEGGEGEVEDEVKVSFCCCQSFCDKLTLLDLLHFSHALTTNAVHLRATAASVSSVNTNRNDVFKSGR